nr:ORF44 [Bracoviriform inaniti]
MSNGADKRRAVIASLRWCSTNDVILLFNEGLDYGIYFLLIQSGCKYIPLKQGNLIQVRIVPGPL